MQRFAALFLIGAVLLPIFDGFHTHSGTTQYGDVWLLRMAWWVPLLFGSTVAFGGLAYAYAYRRLGGREGLASWRAIATGFTIFGMLYFASGFLPVSNAAKLLFILAGAAVVWRIVDGTRQGILLAILNAIVGCTVEMILTRASAFRHLHADAAGIPLWLPALYIAAGPAVGQLARKVLAAPAGVSGSEIRPSTLAPPCR